LNFNLRNDIILNHILFHFILLNFILFSAILLNVVALYNCSFQKLYNSNKNTWVKQKIITKVKFKFIISSFYSNQL